MSGRRWGIGLVTVLATLGTAFVSLCGTLFIVIGMCDYNYAGVEQGSVTDTMCSEEPFSSVFFLSSLFVPILVVVVAGVLGIRSQRWSRLWWGVGLALVLVVGTCFVFDALPKQA